MTVSVETLSSLATCCGVRYEDERVGVDEADMDRRIRGGLAHAARIL